MTKYCMPMVESHNCRYPKYFGKDGDVDCDWSLIADRDGYAAVEAMTDQRQHQYLMSMSDVSQDWIPGIADAMEAFGIPREASESPNIIKSFLGIFAGSN